MWALQNFSYKNKTNFTIISIKEPDHKIRADKFTNVSTDINKLLKSAMYIQYICTCIYDNLRAHSETIAFQNIICHFNAVSNRKYIMHQWICLYICTQILIIVTAMFGSRYIGIHLDHETLVFIVIDISCLMRDSIIFIRLTTYWIKFM